MRTNKILVPAAMVVFSTFGSLSVPSPASAQLANASATTLALSGNTTATARGFAALSVNPAGLGMPGSGFSLALIPLQIRTGIDPITAADLKDVEGKVIPNSVKERWLSQVNAEGGQSGSLGLELSEFAVTFGKIGLQLSTIATGSVNLPPGIVEALLYGNAGRTGTASDLSLMGARVDGFAMTTAGVSLGFPIPSASGDMAVGATVKYTVGHGVAVGRSMSGMAQSDPIRIDIDFPIVMTSEDVNGVNNGNGVGVDLGFMLKRDRLSLGASLLNIVNTFEWDETKLAFRPGTANFEEGSSASEFDEISYGSAPASLRTLVEDMTFKPTLQLGAALDLSPDFTLSADLHNRFSDGGIALAPKFHLGAGAEYRGLRVLHLRGGAAVVTDGIQYSGGASLVLGPINLSAAVAAQKGDLDDTVFGQFTLSFGGR
jgi:F plasmid transfer operon, TraF, protein